MRNDQASDVQLSLLVGDDVPWEWLPDEIHDRVIELFGQLIKDEVKCDQDQTRKEERDA